MEYDHEEALNGASMSKTRGSALKGTRRFEEQMQSQSMSNPFFSNSLKANVQMPEANSNSPAPRDLGTPIRQSRLADLGQ